MECISGTKDFSRNSGKLIGLKQDPPNTIDGSGFAFYPRENGSSPTSFKFQPNTIKRYGSQKKKKKESNRNMDKAPSTTSMHEAILLHLSSSYCSSLQSGTRPMYANKLFHFQSRILPYKLQYPRRQLILVPLFVEGSLQSLHSAGLERDSGIHPHVAENGKQRPNRVLVSLIIRRAHLRD